MPSSEPPKTTPPAIVQPSTTPPPTPDEAPPPAAADTSDLKQRLDKIETTLEELRVEVDSAAPKSTMTEVQGRIDTLEHQAAEAVGLAAAALASLGLLQ